jgi:hypothetical protein
MELRHQQQQQQLTAEEAGRIHHQSKAKQKKLETKKN